MFGFLRPKGLKDIQGFLLSLGQVVFSTPFGSIQPRVSASHVSGVENQTSRGSVGASNEAHDPGREALWSRGDEPSEV